MSLKKLSACSNLLSQQRLTLALAESVTGGRVAADFSFTRKAGDILVGGVICYDAIVKQQLLGVPKELIDIFTPESAEVTAAMAEGLKRIMQADIYVAITGLAGAGGSETPEKPVGTIFIHGIRSHRQFSETCLFQGSYKEIVLKTVSKIADLLIKEITRTTNT